MSDPDFNAGIEAMMVESLMLKTAPDEIADGIAQFAAHGLAMDSINVVELAEGLEKRSGFPTSSAEVARTAFQNVNTIAEFIRSANSAGI